jgi:hypothetical protein
MSDKNPLWEERLDSDGNSSYSEFEPSPITKYHECEHFYEYENNRTLAKCHKCGYDQRIVFGIHKIEDGKLITVIKPQKL